MRALTLITHNDLDGYGCSSIVQVTRPDAFVIHIGHYDDVGPALMRECDRLVESPSSETLVISDLRLDTTSAAAIQRFLTLNQTRPNDLQHRLYVIDHHPGTTEALGAIMGLSEPWLTIVVDKTRCASRILCDQIASIAGETATRHPDLERLAALIDVLDLWKKTDKRFELACAPNDAFWETVAAFVPYGHSQHDRFLAETLLMLTDHAFNGKNPLEIELAVPAVRNKVVHQLVPPRPDLPFGTKTRTRLALFVAEDADLLHDVTTESGRIRIGFDLEGGVFQRLADTLLNDATIGIVASIGRSGEVSLRSRQGQAGAMARLFHGGGHPDAAGGDLPNVRRVDREEAIARFCLVLGISVNSQTSVTITLREDGVTYDILDKGLPIRLRGMTRDKRQVEAVLMPGERSREESYAALGDFKTGNTIVLQGKWEPQAHLSYSKLRSMEFHADRYRIEKR